MPRVTVDVKQLEKFAKDGTRAGDALERELREAVRYATLSGTGVARRMAPRFSGMLTNSIQPSLPTVVKLPNSLVVSGQFKTGSYEWSVVMEYGRRRGQRGPDPMAIWRWVDLKARRGQFHLDRRPGESYEDAVERAAFLVARKIRIQGTDPRGYMRAGEGNAKYQLRKLVGNAVTISVERIVGRE